MGFSIGKLYKIYAGLGGGFGGAYLRGTERFSSVDAALDEAFELAKEEYAGYEGMYGLKSFDECLEEAKAEYADDDIDDELTQKAIEEDAMDIYNNEMESWLDYYVEEVNE